MRNRLLIEHPETGDTYYTGPLAAGQRMIQRDRYARVERNEGHVRVELLDRPDDPTSVAEWGAGETKEEAWRYVLGAACGPIDAEYDEHYLWTLIQLHDDPNPAFVPEED